MNEAEARAALPRVVAAVVRHSNSPAEVLKFDAGGVQGGTLHRVEFDGGETWTDVEVRCVGGLWFLAVRRDDQDEDEGSDLATEADLARFDAKGW